MSDDLYEVLQVHPRADAEAIRAAYQRLSGQYDPARLEGAAEELVTLARQKRALIERAYGVLSDPQQRAAYDAQPGADTAPAAQTGPEGALLDYRPLPPARRAERPQGFNSQPVRPSYAHPGEPRGWQAPAIIAAVLVALVVPITLLVTQPSAPTAAAPTAAPTAVSPTASALEQFEPFLDNARKSAEQNPNSPEGWITYGNLLFDSTIIAREQDPTGTLYQQRLPRWLQATDAYSKALALQPENATVRADLGASLCFYGAAVGDQAQVQHGLDEVRAAAKINPDDLRVLLNQGNCLVNLQPPQTTEAVKSWQRILSIAPPGDQAVGQAKQLIARYEQK
jgi:curved DNA-binding protein CbpA